jgi:hypothetical protein
VVSLREARRAETPACRLRAETSQVLVDRMASPKMPWGPRLPCVGSDAARGIPSLGIEPAGNVAAAPAPVVANNVFAA